MALVLLKATVLLSVTLLAARLLRRAPAATRHQLWSLVFAAVLVLPVFASALPAVLVPIPFWGTTVFPQTSSGSPSERARGTGDSFGAAAQPVRSGPLALTSADREASPGERETIVAAADRQHAPLAASIASNAPSLLLAAWLIGTMAAAATLLLSLLRVRALARTAHDVSDPAWRQAADSLGARLGLRRPARLLMSAAVNTPMAGGLWRPVIFLPASARAWRAERRDVVLAHEIAHLAGKDPLRHVTARLAAAFYWFHPLLWVAARQATVAREQACDEAVLSLGTRPSAYARVLLDLAASMPPSVRALGALPMVDRSLLETRLMAILSENVRPATGRAVGFPAIGVALLTLVVASAQPAVRASVPNLSAPATVRSNALAPAPVGTLRAAAAGATDLATASLQPDLGPDSPCRSDASEASSFSGQISMREAGGRTVIDEQIGTRDGDRIIQTTLGDLRVCMRSEDFGEPARLDRPSQWLGRARRSVIEARHGRAVQRLEIAPQSGGSDRISWRVGSLERPFDAAARQWREGILAVLDTTWELASLRGEVSSLRGEISSIRGEESSLRGEISSLRGEVSSMRGEASSIRGEESSLRGEISSIHGHVSSLRGAISSEHGAISSLNALRYRANDAERAGIASKIRQHEAEIERIEQAVREYDAAAKIAAVEREITTLDAARKVAAIDKAIDTFALESKVAAVERQIAALGVEGKINATERKIDALDAERRVRQLEERREAELKRLRSAIAAIRE